MVYDNTKDTDKLRSDFISMAREILRLKYTTETADAWLQCSGLAPAFALDLVKPKSVLRSLKWRGAKDCITRECEMCDTAVIVSKKASTTAALAGVMVDEDSPCPLSISCGGLLTDEVPNR